MKIFYLLINIHILISITSVVNCQWSSWGVWSQCSVTCGSGTKTKSRTKFTTASNGGRDCAGGSTSSSTCTTGYYQCQSTNTRFPSTINTRRRTSTSRRCSNQSTATAQFLCENSSGNNPVGSLAGATIDAFARDPIGQSVNSVLGLFGK